MLRFILGILFSLVACSANASQTQINSLLNAGRGTATLLRYAGPGDTGPAPLYYVGLFSYSYATLGHKAVRLIRASDSAQQDFVTLSSGVLDIASATAFCNSTTCKVVTLYDQSGLTNCGGAACDFTQATSANQPAFTFNCTGIGTLPCITFAPTTHLDVTTGPVQAQPYSLLTLTTRTGAFTTFAAIWASNGGNAATWLFNDFANQSNLFCSLSTGFTATVTDSIWHSMIAVCNGASSNQTIDGIVTTGNAGALATAGAMSIGYDSVTYNDPMTGNLTELAMYGIGLSAAQAQALYQNQWARFAPQPAIAKTWGFNTLALHDSFTSLSTIDVQNTKSSGFNWYTNGGWPQMAASAAWLNSKLGKPTNPKYLGPGPNGGLTISSDDSRGNFNLSTCAAVGDGTSTVGTAYSSGFYIEAIMAFDPALSTLSRYNWTSWPAFWSAPITFLNGTITNTNFVEQDFFEACPCGGAGVLQEISTVHDWNTSNGTNNENTPSNDVSGALTGATLTLPHRYGYLWVPKALNSGTGLLQFYFDGVHYAARDLSYTASTGTTPALSPSNPNGSLSEMDAESFCINFSTGSNWPLTITDVMLWH